MRLFAFILLILTAGTLYSQATYVSPFTHTYPTIFTSEIIKINRIISFEPNEITIVTEVENGKEIEILTVQEIDYTEGNLLIFCTTRNNRK